MRAAVYSWLDNPHEIERLCRHAEKLGYDVSQRLGGSAGRSAVVRGARDRKFRVVIVRDLADLGDILAELVRTVRELAAFGCDVIPTEGASFEGVPKTALIAVCDAFLDYRKSLYDARSRRQRDKGTRPGPRVKLEYPDVKNGDRIAALLREDDRMTIRAIADHVGVAPGTVMRVKRMMERDGVSAIETKKDEALHGL